MSDEGYSTVEIKRQGEDSSTKEEDFELEVEGLDQDTEEVEENNTPEKRETLTLASDEDVENEDEDNEEEGESSKGKRKLPRSQQRINQLYRERKEWEERYQRDLTEAQRQIEELRKQRETESESFIEEQKTFLENHISTLEDKIKTALEENDTEAFIKAQKDLSEASFKKQILNARPKTKKQGDQEYQKDSPQQKTQQQQTDTSRNADPYANIPEEGREWIKRNPEFTKNRAFHGAAIGVNSELIEEGFDPDSPEFYEELDARLGSLFGKSNSSPNKKKKGIPPVAGGQRDDSPTNKAQKKKTNKVVLTQEELRIAKKFGIDPKTYARNKQKLESNTSSNDYVNIV